MNADERRDGGHRGAAAFLCGYLLPTPYIFAIAGILVALAGASMPSIAQQTPSGQTWTMPPEYRGIQIRAQETQRTLLLSMVDSMPERLYRQRVTPEQRDFAQQIHHAANADLYIVSHYLAGEELPFIQDTAVTLSSREGLRAFVNAAYDYSLSVLKRETDQDRQVMIWYFGLKIPKWQVWDELNQHTIWTAGQIVANFRANGMAPPSFLYF